MLCTKSIFYTKCRVCARYPYCTSDRSSSVIGATMKYRKDDYVDPCVISFNIVSVLVGLEYIVKCKNEMVLSAI